MEDRFRFSDEDHGTFFLRATRKPWKLNQNGGAYLLWIADRQFRPTLPQLPPRNTRKEPWAIGLGLAIKIMAFSCGE